MTDERPHSQISQVCSATRAAKAIARTRYVQLLQSSNLLQLLFYYRRVTSMAGNIQEELLPSKVQGSLKTRNLLPAVFSSCSPLHLNFIIPRCLGIHVCKLRIDEPHLVQ